MADVVAERDRMPRWVPRAIVLFFAGVAGMVVLAWLIEQLQDLLIMILVSIFLSFAIEPAVNKLEAWGIRRGLGTGLVFLGFLGGSVLFVGAMGSVLADQITNFVDEAPGYITDLETWIEDNFDVEVDTEELLNEFQTDGAASEFATRIAGNLVDLGTRVLEVLFQLLTIGLFTFYLVADGPRLRRNICSLLEPNRQRKVLQVWDLAIAKTGGYILSRGILAFISAMVHWAAFAVIDVPFPLPLALWVGVVSQFIPVIGTYIAGALPVLIGLLNDPGEGLAVLIVIAIYQQIENYLLAPPITAQTMEIHVAVAFGAVIAGGAMLGLVGALLALPAAATIQAVLSTAFQQYDLVDEALEPSGSTKRRADEAEHPDTPTT